jgi:O-antigen/teichoic acid export membrane protein
MAERGNIVAAGKASINISMANILNAGMGAVFFAIESRMLTAPELGIIAAVSLAFAVFQTLGQLGLNLSATSLVPEAMVNGDAGPVVSSILLLALVFPLVNMLLAFFLAPYLSLWTMGSTKQTSMFQIGAFIVFANATGYCLDGVTMGMRKFVLLSYSRVAGQITRLIISLVLLFYGYRVAAVLVGYMFGQTGFVSALIQLSAVVRRFHFILPGKDQIISVLSFTLPLQGTAIVQLVAQQLDLAIIVAKGTTFQVGIYSVVLTVSSFMTIGIILPLQNSMVPFMSKSLREAGSLEGIFLKASRYLSLVVIPITMAIALGSQLVIGIIAGPRYLAATLPLAIIMLGMIPFALSMLVSAALQVHGKTRKILAGAIAGIVAEGITGILLVPPLGPVGAAISGSALPVVSLAVGAYLVRSVMRPRYDIDAFFRSILASCAFALMPLLHLFWPQFAVLVISSLASIATFLILLKILHVLRPRDVHVLLNSLPLRLGGIISFIRIEKLANWLAAS